jgi:CubicO group peptidase (beta-lactamase class C family)
MLRPLMLTFGALALLSARPAPDPAADIRAFAERAIAALGTAPGMSIAVVQDGRTVLAEGVGEADRGRKAGPDTPFYIASATKSFTALAIASLARRGVVDLDAPLARWAPDSGIPAEIAARVTLRDLLSHRSGVDNLPIAFRAAYTGDVPAAGMRSLLPSTAPDARVPHGGFRYTNGGYNIATTLIEAKTGLGWQELVRREVLAPLGMRATLSRVPGNAAAAFNGLDPAGPVRIAFLKRDANLQSAGGLFSTAQDLSRWLKVQLGDGMVDGKRIFPAGLVAATHVRQVALEDDFGPYKRTGYGLGWYLGLYGQEPLLHHFGSFPGSRSHISMMPQHRIGVAVMINEDAAANGLADLVANYAYDRLLGRPDLEADHAARLAEAVKQRDERRVRVATGIRERAARPWTLSLPRAAYAGTYRSAAMGTIHVRAEGDRLLVRMDPLAATAEPFTEPDSIRVEIVPGFGQVIRFRPEGGSVPVLRFADSDFTRTR